MHNKRLLYICYKLIEDIPEPYVKPPTPKKTWHQIDSPGERRLQPIAPTERNGTIIGTDETVLVVSIDSHGVTVQPPVGSTFRIENKNWRDSWIKVRKAPKRKGKDKIS
tara:strand:- start:885 stop:1211 length:327 start_codon:yes stop_codon:yes gene_type:complete